MAKEPVSLTRRLRIDTRYLGRNCIIYVTTFLLHSRVDTREANVSATIKPPEEERTEGDAMRRDMARHGMAVAAAAASFPLRECDCGCSIDARRHYAEARMNRDKRRDEETGKCFRVVPLARSSHCYLTRTTRRADARRTRRATSEKERERESIVERSFAKCYSLLGLCTCT